MPVGRRLSALTAELAEMGRGLGKAKTPPPKSGKKLKLFIQYTYGIHNLLEIRQL